MKKKQFILTDKFLKTYELLDGTLKTKCARALLKFFEDPEEHGGFHEEKLNDAKDSRMRTARINKSMRLVYGRYNGQYIFIYADQHDEGTDYCQKYQIKGDEDGSMIEVGPEFAIEIPVGEGKPLFDNMDEFLLSLGLSKELFNKLKQVKDPDDILELEDMFKDKETWELLYLGMSDGNIKELFEEYHKTDDEEYALKIINDFRVDENAAGVDAEGVNALHEALKSPLTDWRVFLHPEQEKIAYRDYDGPVKVLGGAGTGKTVVALHRAKYLASKYDGEDGENKILLTTFTKNLSGDLYKRVHHMCSPKERSKIEVINLDLWVARFVKDNYDYDVKYKDDINKQWEKAINKAHNNLDLPLSFYQDEWDQIYIDQEANTLEDYLENPRNNRENKLNNDQKREVWKVFDVYYDLIESSKRCDINMAMYLCRKKIEENKGEALYDSIIIDEGQDFSDNAYRLIRTMAGKEHKNDIFITGDSHQRIYNNYQGLSKCGINVGDRCSHLTINYRTTAEIRDCAFALLKGISFDDLDDGMDVIDKCDSLMNGARPKEKNFKDEGVWNFKDEDKDKAKDKRDYREHFHSKGECAEFEYVLKEIDALHDNGVKYSDICILSRKKDICNKYTHAIDDINWNAEKDKGNKGYKKKYPYVFLDKQPDNQRIDGIRLADMHRAKGLEFNHVFIVSVNDDLLPLKGDITNTDPVADEKTRISERCLLYVSMTRARESVHITSYGKPSEFLDLIKDYVDSD